MCLVSHKMQQSSLISNLKQLPITPSHGRGPSSSPFPRTLCPEDSPVWQARSTSFSKSDYRQRKREREQVGREGQWGRGRMFRILSPAQVLQAPTEPSHSSQVGN